MYKYLIFAIKLDNNGEEISDIKYSQQNRIYISSNKGILYQYDKDAEELIIIKNFTPNLISTFTFFLLDN